jgi:hypothetical protein
LLIPYAATMQGGEKIVKAETKNAACDTRRFEI